MGKHNFVDLLCELRKNDVYMKAERKNKWRVELQTKSLRIAKSKNHKIKICTIFII